MPWQIPRSPYVISLLKLLTHYPCQPSSISPKNMIPYRYPANLNIIIKLLLLKLTIMDLAFSEFCKFQFCLDP